MIIQTQGGANRRVGSQFVLDEIHDGDASFISLSENTRIIPFVVSEDESYLIIFPGVHDGSDIPFVYIYNIQTQKFTAEALAGLGGTGVVGASLDAYDFEDAQTLREMQYAQTGDLLFIVH